jgi:hypothetical protein
MNFKERKNLLEGKQQVHLLRFLDQLNDDEKQILFSQIDAVDWGFEQAFHNDKKKEDTMIEEIDALHLDKIQADSVLSACRQSRKESFAFCFSPEDRALVLVSTNQRAVSMLVLQRNSTSSSF